MKSPFQFLDAYSAEDKDRFFGRDQEIDQLYKKVNRNRLTLVYGQSGSGKTSLVRCGLAGRFNPVDWFPIFIRRGRNFNESLRAALLNRIEDQMADDATLPELIEEAYDHNLRPVYLIFDQFEELFILGTEAEQDQFFVNLKNIIDARLSCRVIIIQREEYLAHLYRFEETVPSLLDSRLRVELMSPKKVAEVIEKSCEQFNITLEAPQHNIQQIIGNVQSENGTIQLPFLQVYLDLFYRKDYERSYPDGHPDPLPPLLFETGEIERFGGISRVLDDFLEEQETQIQAQITAEFAEFPDDGVRQLLDVFVTTEGTKRPVSYEKKPDGIVLEEPIQQRLPFAGTALGLALNALSKSRILRGDEKTYELAHDSLAPLIESRRSTDQRMLNELRLNFQSSYRLYQSDQSQYLSPKLLNNIDPFLDRLGLNNEERAYVELSQQHWQKRRRQTRLTVLSVGTVLAILTIISLISARQANRALTQLKGATGQIFENLVIGAEKDVLDLDYESALAKVRDAVSLNSDPQRAGKALLEFAFLYGEAQQFEQSLPLVDTLLILYGGAGSAPDFEAAAGAGDTLSMLRDFLKALDPAGYMALTTRYYPDMVAIQGNTFLMGCDTTTFEFCTPDQQLHSVQLNDFRIARYETTNWQYHLYCLATGEDNIERTEGGWPLEGNLPVVQVNWEDAHRYLTWLNGQFGQEPPFQIDVFEDISTLDPAAVGFRLPTEAEWEYAARAGQSRNIFSGGAEIDLFAWYANTAEGRPRPIGMKQSNQFDLFDLSGNVSEWCWDQKLVDFFPDSTYINPTGGNDDVYERTVRGGDWTSFPNYCTVFFRSFASYDSRNDFYGFRVAQGGRK